MVFFFLWLVILEGVSVSNLVISGGDMIFYDDGEDETENEEPDTSIGFFCRFNRRSFSFL